jgi:hypothetical protein
MLGREQVVVVVVGNTYIDSSKSMSGKGSESRQQQMNQLRMNLTAADKLSD